MADLIIDPDLVGIGGAGTRVVPVQASLAIPRGKPVIKDTETDRYGLADALTVEGALVTGLCVSPASGVDAWFEMLEFGPVILGVTLLKGKPYALSPTTGLIMPVEDLAVGDFVTELGVASSSTVLEFLVNATGIQRA